MGDWSVQLSDGRLYAPIVADGTAYVADTSGILTAFDTETREIRWTAEPRGQEYAPTILGNTVYVTGTDVFALSTADGTERWRAKCDRAVTIGPVVEGGTCSSAATDGSARSTPRLARNTGRIVAAATDLERSMLSLRTVAGRSQSPMVKSWQSVPPGAVWSVEDDIRTVAVDDSVYAGTDDNEIIAFDFRGNERCWVALDRGESVSSLVANDGVYAVTTSVMSTGTDRREWFVSLDDSEVTLTFYPKFLPFGTHCAPAVADGTVYVGAIDRRVYALSASDGTECRRFETGGEVKSVSVGEQVYASSDTVYAFRR